MLPEELNDFLSTIWSKRIIINGISIILSSFWTDDGWDGGEVSDSDSVHGDSRIKRDFSDDDDLSKNLSNNKSDQEDQELDGLHRTDWRVQRLLFDAKPQEDAIVESRAEPRMPPEASEKTQSPKELLPKPDLSRLGALVIQEANPTPDEHSWKFLSNDQTQGENQLLAITALIGQVAEAEWTNQRIAAACGRQAFGGAAPKHGWSWYAVPNQPSPATTPSPVFYHPAPPGWQFVNQGQNGMGNHQDHPDMKMHPGLVNEFQQMNL